MVDIVSFVQKNNAQHFLLIYKSRLTRSSFSISYNWIEFILIIHREVFDRYTLNFSQ